MRYISTRGQVDPMPFLDAVLTGQAADGGLLVPEHIPNASAQLDQWRELSYQQLACELLGGFMGDIPPDLLCDLVNKSYTDFAHPQITPVVKRGDRYILELFHGPTLAFKDIGLQLLGNLFEYTLATKGQRRLNILCATSGDTGSAAIAGLKGKDGISVTVLYPHERPSQLQRLQMTTAPEPNVHCLAIKGSFDDCQAIVKAIFNDTSFKRKHAIGAVNSINWARILGQIVYYFYAYFQATSDRQQQVVFSIPTGNFGNSLACYIAAKMGLPVANIIVATNDNNILATLFNNGIYRREQVQATLSPSMDIQVASNIERYLYSHFNNDPVRVQQFFQNFTDQQQMQVDKNRSDRFIDPLIRGCSVDTEATLAAMKSAWHEHQYVLDPHTAVGVSASQHIDLPADAPVICVATAHPAKFPDTVALALGENNVYHPSLKNIDKLPEKYTEMPADQAAVMAHIAALA